MGKKYKLTFYSMVFKPFFSLEAMNDAAEINEKIFKTIHANYRESIAAGHLSDFSCPGEDDGVLYMVTEIEIHNGMLYGVFGKCQPRLGGFVREHNSETHITKDVTPSEPENLFENYTYFVVSAESRRLAILNNASLPRNALSCIISILRKAIRGEVYEIIYSQLIESDIRKKLKSFSSNLKITGTLLDRDGIMAREKRSIKETQASLGVPFSAIFHFSAKVTRGLTDSQIDALENMTTTDGYKSLKIEDAGEVNEAIDMLKGIVAVSKYIEIEDSDKGNAESIWNSIALHLRAI